MRPVSLAHKLARCFLPATVYDCLRSWRERKQQVLHRWLQLDLERNHDLLNRHAGQRCFILATGPSIQRQDLTALGNELCIAVSMFHLHDQINTIRPEYHVLAPVHAPFSFNDLDILFNSLKIAYANRNIPIFLGHADYEFSYHEYLKTHPEFSQLDLHYLALSREQLEESNSRRLDLWDLQKPLFAPRTVIYLAIQLAAYMGVSEIVLLGCDHDYLHDITRKTDHHFYAETKGISDEQHLSQFNSERWFFEYANRWRQYRLMREVLADRGCSIINATDGGMLDVFPRRPLHTMLSTSASLKEPSS